MPPTEILLSTLCLLGALQGLLLGLAVGTLAEGPKRANRVLALILLSFASVLVVILLSHRAGSGTARSLELVEYSMWLIAGPLTYLYVSLVATGDRLKTAAFLPHLVPVAVWLAYLVLHFAGALGPSPPWRPPVVWLMLYQMLYTALAIWRWRSAAGAGALTGVHALWVPALIVVLLVQHGAQLVRWRWRDVGALEDVVPLVGAASFVVIAFLGLRRALPLLGKARRRYAGSSLDAGRSREIASGLTEALERDRLYVEPDLGLDELAATLGVPRTHLSQVVNQRFGESLTDHLGRYRLRESERLLADESVSHLTIEAIARRSGFRSRSAFYEAFRRRHGITPSEFRRRAGETATTEAAGSGS